MTEPPENSNGLRTTLSFLLFVHLFAILVAASSNMSPPSPLRTQLTVVPFVDSYTALLNMETGYNFEISDYMRVENEEIAWLYTDQFLEIELDWQGETTPDAKRLVFSASGQGGNLVAGKYRNLLRMIPMLFDGQLESALPQLIVDKHLDEQGIRTGKHRVRLCHWQPLFMAEVRSVDQEVRDPFGPARRIVTYEADISFYENELIYTRAASAFELAPRRGRGK